MRGQPCYFGVPVHSSLPSTSLPPCLPSPSLPSTSLPPCLPLSLPPSLLPPSPQFGKGVYFADMCSKSANYCFTSRARREGLLVLCDVSLGRYTLFKLVYVVYVGQFQVKLMTYLPPITMPTSSPEGNTVLKVSAALLLILSRSRNCTSLE